MRGFEPHEQIASQDAVLLDHLEENLFNLFRVVQVKERELKHRPPVGVDHDLIGQESLPTWQEVLGCEISANEVMLKLVVVAATNDETLFQQPIPQWSWSFLRV